MPRYAKNKMKMWRRIANKLVIDIPREIEQYETTDDAGNVLRKSVNSPGATAVKTTITDKHILTGRQVKHYLGLNLKLGMKAPVIGLMKILISSVIPQQNNEVANANL